MNHGRGTVSFFELLSIVLLDLFLGTFPELSPDFFKTSDPFFLALKANTYIHVECVDPRLPADEQAGLTVVASVCVGHHLVEDDGVVTGYTGMHADKLREHRLKEQ